MTLEHTMLYETAETAVNIPTHPPVKPSYFNTDKVTDKRKIDKIFKKGSLLTDITPLLILPQKVAAARLGISESMLCKRFKERTNRKWPYRFLRKLERQIACSTNPQELEQLSMERDKCLSPVSIRVRRYRSQQEVDQLCLNLTDEALIDSSEESN